jgi:hypothetical protein
VKKNGARVFKRPRSRSMGDEQADFVELVEETLLDTFDPPPEGATSREIVLFYSAQCSIAEDVGEKLDYTVSNTNTNASFRFELYFQHASARGYVSAHYFQLHI